MEYVTCGDTEFVVRELPEKLRILNTIDPDSGDSLLVAEFKVCEVGGHLYLTTPGERCSVHFLFVNIRASLRTVFMSTPKMFWASVTWTDGWRPNIFLFKHWMCLLAYQRQVTHMKHSVKDGSMRKSFSPSYQGNLFFNSSSSWRLPRVWCVKWTKCLRGLYDNASLRRAFMDVTGACGSLYQ